MAMRFSFIIHHITPPIFQTPLFVLPSDSVFEAVKDMKIYPRAHENRVSPIHPSFPDRKAFIKAAATNFVLLQILFLSLFCYIYGAIFNQQPRTHHLQVLYVDYDGGVLSELQFVMRIDHCKEMAFQLCWSIHHRNLPPQKI